MADYEGSNPLEDIHFYVNEYSQAALSAKSLSEENPEQARLIRKIADQPTGIWLGEWNTDITKDVDDAIVAAQAKDSVPIFVLYNIPERDQNMNFSEDKWHSGGGAVTEQEYIDWIQSIVDGLKDRKAIIILEPDAIAHAHYFEPGRQKRRLALLKRAISLLATNSNAIIYLDAEDSVWIEPSALGELLVEAGIDDIQGFSMNVSYFRSTSDVIEYGKAISAHAHDKHFVFDTSRNGLGEAEDKEWCNPTGRALGVSPTTSTDDPLVDAYLWIKAPGESDGEANGGPKAGIWWTEYAVGLAERAA